MARIRTIKPEFWGDEKLAPMPPLARLVFLGLLSMADDAGRLVDNVKSIDGFLFPETDDTAREALEQLAAAGRILRYTTPSGQRLLQVANWARHQKVDHAAKYVLPAPPGYEPPALEPAATPSRGSREGRATVSRSDLRPTTNDLRPATSESDGPGHASAAAPPAGNASPNGTALAALPLDRLRERWLSRFYGDAPPARRVEVDAQLDALLGEAGVPFGRAGHRRQIRATPASLHAALLSTLTDPGAVRTADRAIVVVLLKCEEGRANLALDAAGRTVTEAARERGAAERQRDARAFATRQADAAEWLAQHPADAAEIAALVDAELPEAPGTSHARAVRRVQLAEQRRGQLAGVG